MAQFDGFPADCLKFLRDLAQHNERPWFNANKQRYEDGVRNPSLAFIADMDAPLKKLSPNFLALPKKVGGSLMRVYRDTRFANDKTPFKTNVGIHFRHESAKDVHAPGFYVHIEPGNCFLGAGIWHPEAKALAAIREFIADNPNAWKQATRAAAFRKRWELVGDALVRPPRGFDPEHELIADLKRKDFIACMNFDEAEIEKPKFAAFVARHFKDMVPLVSYLCMAVEVEF
ncbi:MAG: DUF2461 domain-containing protein [Gammaproteobacteria bacterium]